MELIDKNLYAYCDNNPVMRVDSDGEFWLNILAGAAVGALSQLTSDVVTWMVNGGEFELSSISSYVGASVGGAVAMLIPNGGVLADITAAAVTTVVSMLGNNIENSVTGKSDRYCFEEIFYNTVSNVMLVGLTSTVVRTSDLILKNSFLNVTISKSDIKGVDVFAGIFPAVVGGFRNSTIFSNYIKASHRWERFR